MIGGENLIIGFNALGEKNNIVFNNKLCHVNYNKLEITGGIIGQLYIDENTLIPYSIEKDIDWQFTTSLLAKFQNNLEGGSVGADNIQIEKIRFQKRRWDELEWHDVAEIEYQQDQKILYEAIDKYIANDFVYQYSIIPITSTILGNRVISDEITAKFDGIFISDKDFNYELLYDIDLSDIEHEISSALFKPIGGKFPIAVCANTDYETFDITSTFISTETIASAGNEVNIRMERLGKDKLLQFMKNGKPKVYRDYNGRLKLVSVLGNPREIPLSNIGGIAKLSFSLVEIGEMDSETLRTNNMLQGLVEVF